MSRSTRIQWLLGLALAMACALPVIAQAQNQIMVEQKVSYLNSPNNIRISNGVVELIIATDYGPRIMRYALIGSGDDGNVFATISGVTLKTDAGDWYIRGGHRLWVAPEANPRSYEPDNDPIPFRVEGNTIKLEEPSGKLTQVKKEIWITLDPQNTHVTVEHRLTNYGQFAVDMSCWAMSAMNKGGTAILPQEPYKSHDEELLPARPLTLWAYTNLTDPRWMIGKSFITLRQDVNLKEPQKIGVLNKQQWAAYSHNGTLFIKRFPWYDNRPYPDFGCNNETFTNDVFLELETLGPLEHVEPGKTISHTEHWWLFKDVDIGHTEASIAAAMQPILTQTATFK